MKDKITWEIVNGYVDGELAPREAAEVAKAVATDPEIAEYVSMLSSLKAAVAYSTDGVARNIDLSPTTKKSKKFGWLPWAAGIATLLILGALMSALVVKPNLLYPASGVQLAEMIHTEWLKSEYERPTSKDRALLKATLEGLYLDAYVPDLTKVNLSFSGIRRVTAQGVEGVHIGYVGPRGCMVSLVVFKNHIRLSEKISYFRAGGRPVYGWRVGTTGFYLLAHKMDPYRVDSIAEVVHELTRARLPLDPQSVIALNDARASSEPCVT